MNGKQYNHLITPSQAAKGMNLARENAISLYEDAILLFEHHRYARATALMILAIEEIGKISILRLLVLQSTAQGVQTDWKSYRQHTSKNVMWQVPDLIREGASRLNHFKKIFNDKESSWQLDSLKQLAFYTDNYNKCKWSSPKDVIDRGITEDLILIAEILIRPETHTVVTDLEIEIWVKHMKPTLKDDTLSLEALNHCYEELELLGLIKAGTGAAMKDFVSPQS